MENLTEGTLPNWKATRGLTMVPWTCLLGLQGVSREERSRAQLSSQPKQPQRTDYEPVEMFDVNSLLLPGFSLCLWKRSRGSSVGTCHTAVEAGWWVARMHGSPSWCEWAAVPACALGCTFLHLLRPKLILKS